MKFEKLLKILDQTSIIFQKNSLNKDMFDYAIFTKKANTDYIHIIYNTLDIVVFCDFSLQKEFSNNFKEISVEEFKLALL